MSRSEEMTASHVSAGIVEATWQRVAALEPEEARAMQARSGRLQPELTAFVIAFTHELRPDAIGLGLYAMLVVYEAFRISHFKVHKARERLVLRQWQAASAVVASLREKAVQPADLSTVEVDTAEPHVLRYVIDALTEEPDEDPVHLDDEEFWQLFAVLKTVVETLHEVAGAQRPV